MKSQMSLFLTHQSLPCSHIIKSMDEDEDQNEMLVLLDTSAWVVMVAFVHTVKPVKNGHSKKDKIKTLMTNGSLMKVEIIAECSKGSILQYFWPALSDIWSWKPIFSFF